jgi:ribose/xylose/arabinose/galactoside ABC-type transport system permease subunit
LRGVSLGLTNGTTLFNLPGSFLHQGAAKSLGAPASIRIAGFFYLVRGGALRDRQLGRALFAIGGVSRRLGLRSIESTPYASGPSAYMTGPREHRSRR